MTAPTPPARPATVPPAAALPVWRFLWRLEGYRPGLHLIDTALWTAAAAGPLVSGLVLRRLFDALAAPGPAAGPGTPALLALLLGLAVSRMALYVAGVYVDLTYRYHLRTLLRRNALEHLLARPGAGPAPAPGDVVNRLYEDAGESEELVAQWQYQVVAALYAAAAVLVLVRVDPMMTLVAVLPVVGATVLAQAAGARLGRYRRASRAATGRVTATLGEVFGAVQAVQAAGREAAVVEHVRELGARRRRAALADAAFAQLLDALQGNTVAVATGAVLLLAGHAMRAGTFTVGDLALFIAYLSWLTEFARGLGAYLRQYRQRAVSVQRLTGLLPGAPPDALVRHAPVFLSGPLPPLVPPARTAADRLEVLEVSGLTFRHPRSGRGVEGAGFDLTRGSLTVVTGRVGAGKTTLLRVLLGLLPRQAGEIRWNGAPIGDPGAVLVPPRCAYVPQTPGLFSDTLRGNVLLGLPEAAADLPGALRLAALERDLTALALGLDTPVGPRGVRLSGGQIHRTAAARALVREPELLVLDDLTSALDGETERALWEGLRRRRDATGLAILAVSHRREALERADRILVLEDGHITGAGALDELLASCQELRLLWESQSRPPPTR